MYFASQATHAQRLPALLKLLGGRGRAPIESFITMLHEYKPGSRYHRFMPPTVGTKQGVEDLTGLPNAKVNPLVPGRTIADADGAKAAAASCNAAAMELSSVYAAEVAGMPSLPHERNPAMQPASARRQFHTAFWLYPVTLLLLALCAPSASAATKVVTDADKGGTVELKMGDVLEVRLNANPSTGYMWYLQKQSTALLKLTSQTQTEATQPGVGRPIVQIFEFAPKATGTGVLLLHYVRSWLNPDPNEEQFSLHVTIE